MKTARLTHSASSRCSQRRIRRPSTIAIPLMSRVARTGAIRSSACREERKRRLRRKPARCAAQMERPVTETANPHTAEEAAAQAARKKAATASTMTSRVMTIPPQTRRLIPWPTPDSQVRQVGSGDAHSPTPSSALICHASTRAHAHQDARTRAHMLACARRTRTRARFRGPYELRRRRSQWSRGCGRGSRDCRPWAGAACSPAQARVRARARARTHTRTRAHTHVRTHTYRRARTHMDARAHIWTRAHTYGCARTQGCSRARARV